MYGFEHHTESYQEWVLATRPHEVPAETLRKMLQDAREECDALEADHERELEEKEQEIDELERECDQLQERIDQLLGRSRIEYQIEECYLPALINGDYSGLEDREITQIEGFLLSEKLNGGLFVTENDEEGAFVHCDVSGLRANCHTVYWMREY